MTDRFKHKEPNQDHTFYTKSKPREENMITTNDINNAKQKCYQIYETYQATLAGQLGHDLAELQDSFEEICAEFGLNIEDTWEECENQHEGLIAWNGS